tara:strand:+ start:1654 stop:2121 length:468 start_codon:yes stop_codon:yes gene_type:complete
VRVLFCHGKEGTPRGTKATAIKDEFGNGIVVAPRLTNSYCESDFASDLLVVEALTKGADVIVGSSRGGALVCQADVDIPKIMIAPAWKKFSVLPMLTKNDVILHSKHDALVPYEDSVRLAELFGCRLIECGEDHRMSDPDTLALIKETIKEVTSG